MEQKKLLWIAIAVGTFLLIITGTILLVNVPGKKNSDFQQAQVNSGKVWTFDGTGAGETDSGHLSPETPDVPEKPAGAVGGDLVAVSPEKPENPAGVPEIPVDKNPAVPVPESGKELDVGTIKADKISANVIDVREITNTPAPPKVQAEKPKVKEPAKPVVSQKQPAAAYADKTADTVKTETISYWIQLASLTDKLKAEKAREDLNEKMISPEIFTKEIDGKIYYRLRIGPYKTKQEADYWLAKVKEMNGFEKSYISEIKK